MTAPSRVAAAILLVGSAARAGGPGSTFGDGLRLTNTAWALGMGGAMVASGEGVSAVVLNPAGVLDGGVTTLHLTHAFYVEKLWEDFFAYTQRLPMGSALGVSVHGVYDSSTPRALEDNGGAFAGEAGTYPLGFVVAGAAYAADLSWLRGVGWLKPSAGIGARVLYQQVDKASWLGVTTDLGVKVRPGAGFAIGGVLQNAGTAAGPGGLPLQWVTGIAWQHEGLAGARDRLLVEVDSPIAVDLGFSLRAGMEYRVVHGAVSAAVRAGWKQEVEVPGAPGISSGIGFRWRMGRLPWGMDYAFIPWGVFGSVHAISLTVGILPPAAPDETRITTPQGHEPPAVFYPLKNEPLRYVLHVDAPAELSAVLLDEQGAALATLMEKRIVQPGDAEISWNGVLPNGQWADFDRTYRILIQMGDQAWYRDVVPKRE